MKYILAVIFLLVATPLTAWDSGWTYDYDSGSSYRYYDGAYGSTNVQGMNFRTGSIWNTRIEADGDMSGIDAEGNFWNYNYDTGNYFNYGTGEHHNTKYGW